MNDIGVYLVGRRFKVRPFVGPAGLVCLAGGETKAERRQRAHRLATLFNTDADEARAARRVAREQARLATEGRNHA